LSAGFLVFSPAMDANGVGYASFDFRVRDNGGVSNGGVDTEFGTHTFTVNVTPVNNPPTVSSNSLVISEGAAVVLTSANVNTQDVDNLASELLISVSGLSNGQFEYVANAGVAISSFTQADINAGLVRFVHDGSQNAPAYMLAVSDGVANTGPQSAAIVFNETNDAPLIGYSAGAVLVNEDGLQVFSIANGNAIVLSDADAGGATVRLALSANNGNLLLASVSGISIVFGADGSASMVLEGTLAAINNALNGLSYTALPNFNGADGISLLLDDLGNSGSGGPLSAVLGIAVTVSPVNDAPMIALPAVQNVGEDVALVLGGSNRLQIADVDAAGAQVELTLSVNFGLISLSSLSGLSFVSGDGLADGSMVVRGTVAELNAALDGLVYTPDANFYGAASLSIAVNDLGNTGGAALGASASLTINVLAQNDAPSQLVPGAQTTLEDTALVFAGANRIQIVDLDAGAAVVRVSLQVGAGSLSLSATAGLSFSQGDGVSDSAMQFSGTLAAINAALNGLVYLPDPNVNGSDQLLITTEDLGNVGSGGSLLRFDQVAITVLAVNDPISVSAPSNLQIPEDTMAFVQSANGQFFTLQDIDSQGFPVQIVVSVDIGLLQLSSLAGITVLQGDPAGSSMLTLRGELTSINDALTTLRYSPPADYFGSARISVSADDLGGQPSSGPSALAQANLDVMVTGVNDAPELTLANTLFTVQQLGVGQAVSEGVAIRDVDSTALMQAVALVSSGFEVGKDVLYLDSSVLDVATRNAISAVWDGATGQLLLTGSASASQYASALSALRFSTTSTNPSQRAVAFSVGDGQVNSPVSKSIGSMSFAVTVAPVGPVVVTTDPVVAIAPGLQPTPTQIDGTLSGADTGSNLSTPVVSANDASSSVLSQVEAENDLADRQRRSVRVDFDGVNGSAAASVRANKLNLKTIEVASPLLGLDLNLRADAAGELRFEERGDAIWKLGTGNKYTGSRTAARFSDLEEQRLVEDIARESKASDTLHLEISAAQATSAGAAAFATLLLWSIRAGGIVAAIATSAPAWRNMDPLPLLLDEKGSGVDEPAWGDTETPTVAAVDGSTMMDAQALLNGA
jgi:Cadherin-like